MENDLIYLLLPNVIAAFVYVYAFCSPASLEVFAALTILYAGNVFHQAATWFHYLDKRNRDYYFGTWKQRCKFILLPLLVVVLSIVGSFVYSQLVMLIYILWSIPHFVQQNVGILLLYHNPKLGEAVVDRGLEVKTQQFAGLFFGLMIYHRLALSHTSAAQISSAVLLVAFTVFAASCILYLSQLILKARQGLSINVPALFFWFVSITFFLPFAYAGSDFSVSILIPSMLHWLQYIGLNYVMVKRKYGGDSEQAENLVWAKPIMLFVGFCSLILLVQFGSFMFCNYEWPQKEYKKIWNCLFLGLGMSHYLLDGFIWKFREPYNRQAMLPYLVHREPSAERNPSRLELAFATRFEPLIRSIFPRGEM